MKDIVHKYIINLILSKCMVTIVKTDNSHNIESHCIKVDVGPHKGQSGNDISNFLHQTIHHIYIMLGETQWSIFPVLHQRRLYPHIPTIQIKILGYVFIIIHTALH